MSFQPEISDKDVDLVHSAMAIRPETKSVTEFIAGPGIQRLDLRFDIGLLREALDECLARAD